MGYAIICDARKGEALGIHTLALVDRAKSRRQWWTSDNPALVLHYRSQSAAAFAAGRLRRNNARVVAYEQAISHLLEQVREIDHQQAVANLELGWDAHKDIF